MRRLITSFCRLGREPRIKHLVPGAAALGDVWGASSSGIRLKVDRRCIVGGSGSESSMEPPRPSRRSCFVLVSSLTPNRKSCASQSAPGQRLCSSSSGPPLGSGGVPAGFPAVAPVSRPWPHLVPGICPGVPAPRRCPGRSAVVRTVCRSWLAWCPWLVSRRDPRPRWRPGLCVCAHVLVRNRSHGRRARVNRGGGARDGA